MECIPKARVATIGDAVYGQYRGAAFPKINWGRGRLRQFESLGAFMAKFCALNDISGKECRSFFSQVTGQDKWWLKGFGGEALRLAALLLDEPEPIVKSLSGESLVLPACYGKFSFAFHETPRVDELTYCPECRAVGYHALFHEFSWLKQCPIHCVDLVHVNVYGGIGTAHFDAYIKSILDLFGGKTGKWLSIHDQSRIEDLLASPNLQRFLGWLRSAQTLSHSTYRQNIVSSFGASYGEQDLGVLLGRLDWAAPLPNNLRGIFRIPPQRQKPTITECDVKAARHLMDVLATVKYDSLAQFFRQTAILNEEMPLARRVVMDAVEKLQKIETRRHSSWGWLRRMGWVAVDPDGWPYWQVIKAGQFLIRQLQGKWIDFIEEDSSSMQEEREWYAYRMWAKILHQKGIVEPLQKHLLDDGNLQVAAQIQPLVTFAIESDARELLEVLQYHEALADLEATYLWLENVHNRGVAPFDSPIEMVSGGNLLLEEARAYFMVWPRESLSPEGLDFQESERQGGELQTEGD